ncbi:spore germination protein [Alkalihalobacillus pseudalcaliphilus]|uniref:spore germination protein n=1 Tax=Alkalihalobacillus pseudalcaliphilus TaxID=79884 RepID=UPI000B2AC7E9|nr:spore germination protein [Alkalihalobacillus pseudalcaliphilus]
MKRKITASYQENLEYLKKELGTDESMDMICLEMEHADLRMAFFVVDGFAKDTALTEIQEMLARTTEKELRDDPLRALTQSRIPYIEIDTEKDLDEVVDQVLSGPTALLVEGITEVIIIDTREYPVRGPEEPDTEQVIRGSKDGFVETLVMNAALIRRRVRDRTFRVEYVQVGRRSKTDITLCYIGDIADNKMIEEMKASIQKIDTDGLPMADKTIEEFVFGHHYQPYPLVRYTERPDVAATQLFEGHVVILVDGSPSAMVAPTTFWHHLQHAEEYRQKPIIGAGLRLVRFVAVWASIFLMPLWFLLAEHQQFVPEVISFVGSEEEGTVPLFAQFLAAEVGIEMLRMASIHTPNALATALGLVAALLIGEVAIEVGLFSPEVVLYLAVAVVGSFATPSYELSLANRSIRVALLVLTAFFGLGGFLVGTTLWIFMLVRIEKFDTPYFWPLIPFNMRALRDVILRAPMPLKNRRPTAIHPKDPDR